MLFNTGPCREIEKMTHYSSLCENGVDAILVDRVPTLLPDVAVAEGEKHVNSITLIAIPRDIQIYGILDEPQREPTRGRIHWNHPENGNDFALNDRL
jgi:hypothetical protein